MKIYSSWGAGKTSRKPNRTTLKAKIRWDVIGLQDPKLKATAPSMEYIRSQIIAMASQGLGAHLHADEKHSPGKPSGKATDSIHKRRRSATA